MARLGSNLVGRVASITEEEARLLPPDLVDLAKASAARLPADAAP
jgi:hypothetical protein